MTISARKAFDFVKDVAKNEDSNYLAASGTALCSVFSLLPYFQSSAAWTVGVAIVGGLTVKAAAGGIFVAINRGNQGPPAP